MSGAFARRAVAGEIFTMTGIRWVCCVGLVACVSVLARADGALPGFDDTPMLPGGKWHVHDKNRPHPVVVTPGTCSTQELPGKPPADAVVLFDGKDLSHWETAGRDAEKGRLVPARWKVVEGAMEVVAKGGDVFSKEKFGDCQVHLEWCAPPPKGHSQERSNSGVFLHGLYEIQVLDCYDNPTYADGTAGSVYGQHPALVNACRKPGEWQSYDIIFEPPRFDADKKLVRPAYVTVLLNGVLVQHRQEIIGAGTYRRVATYQYHEPTGPIKLQDHGNPVRYRNIWVRPLKLAE